MTAKKRKGLKPKAKPKPTPERDPRGTDAVAILDRIKEHYQMNKEADLARHLDISTSLLANWRKRNSLDHKRVIERCGEECDLNWIFLGRHFEETAQMVDPQTQLFQDTKRSLEPEQVKEMMFDAMKTMLEEKGIEVKEGKKDSG